MHTTQPTLKQDFQLLVCALLGGHNLALDTLTKHNPKLLLTMEDYLWVKLSLVKTATAAGAQQQLGGGGGGGGGSMLSGGGMQATGEGAVVFVGLAHTCTTTVSTPDLSSPPLLLPRAHLLSLCRLSRSFSIPPSPPFAPHPHPIHPPLFVACATTTLAVPHPTAYTLTSLQSELNRWDSKYYTSGGKDPLVYLTVLLLSLQFK